MSSEKEMEGGGAKALQKTHHALVTGTNMPPIPQTISMMAPPANGTPSFNIEPGLAIRDNAVIVPKRPVVMRRACGTMAGATLSIMYLWKQAHTSQHSSGVSEREREGGILQRDGAACVRALCHAYIIGANDMPLNPVNAANIPARNAGEVE